MPLSKRIALFASGSGTNAENIISYFKKSTTAAVTLVLTNNSLAGVIERVEKHNVPVVVFDKAMLNNPEGISRILKNNKIDLIVLAGFLLKIPASLLIDFPDRIINIHPALLPKYGGKGMYGMNVHRAVIESGEQYSGITIHKVTEQYDEGQIVFQKELKINKNETPKSLALRVHKLEYKYFPKVIEKYLF